MRPVHKIKNGDALRPTFDYIQVKAGQVCSTNAHQMLVLKVEEVFGKEVIGPDDELYFKKGLWQKSGLDKAVQITREGLLFNAIGKGFKTVGQMTALDKEAFENKIGRFPDWPCAVPDPTSPLVDTPDIGFNPSLMFDLCSGFGKEDQRNFRFFFRGDSKAIIVKHKNVKGFGLIMPTKQFEGNHPYDFNYPEKVADAETESENEANELL